MASTANRSRGSSALSSRAAAAGERSSGALSAGGELARSLALLGPVSWSAEAPIDYREWLREGQRIGLIARGSPWWIGDWLRYGSTRWGEMYSVAARITGYDPKSLRNMRYVASRFDLSLRKDKLTWSHHALLASLQRSEQQRWLERAIADRLSVADLRNELRAQRRRQLDAQSTPRRQAERRTVRCPNCGEGVPLPQDRTVAAEQPSMPLRV